jgi:hypothetical protein
VKNIFILLSVIFFSFQSHAQDDGGSGRPSQAGVSVGKVLPNGVTTEDEIFSLWGVRYSIPAGRGSGYYDLGGYIGSSNGVDWYSGFASISMHIPVETLIGHAGVGIDYTNFETSTQAAKSEFGGHFVGGVMSQIGGNVFARFDMKLNSKPGTSLFFGLGLVIELDGSSSDEGAK